MRRTKARVLLAFTIMLCAKEALADSCPVPTAPAAFPEPTTATEQDILAAQQSVKQYLSGMEAAIKCMDAQFNITAHNNAVDDMQKTATKFNTVLRAFRSRKS